MNLRSDGRCCYEVCFGFPYGSIVLVFLDSKVVTAKSRSGDCRARRKPGGVGLNRKPRRGDRGTPHNEQIATGYSSQS